MNTTAEEVLPVADGAEPVVEAAILGDGAPPDDAAPVAPAAGAEVVALGTAVWEHYY